MDINKINQTLETVGFVMSTITKTVGAVRAIKETI